MENDKIISDMTDRELDIEIARKIMKITPILNEDGMVFTRHREWVQPGEYYYEGTDSDGYAFADEVPHYSSNISDAWQVVEEMRGVFVLDIQDHILYWDACFVKYRGEMKQNIAHAPTPWKAICIAALRAISNPNVTPNPNL